MRYPPDCGILGGCYRAAPRSPSRFGRQDCAANGARRAAGSSRLPIIPATRRGMTDATAAGDVVDDGCGLQIARVLCGLDWRSRCVGARRRPARAQARERNDRSGALPHDRGRRRDAPHAGGFLHPADLAGEQLPARRLRAARARRASRSSCPAPRPSAGSPIRSIPSRRSRNRRNCWTICGARFGNLGLAAAAYNGGPARVEAWLAGRGGLPGETRSYVSIITGRTADDWASDARGEPAGRGRRKRRRRAASFWSRRSAAAPTAA